ncbi:MAG: transposase [Paraprevotella sp.]|nr:transposase [Paraprevotella sp.]
MDVLLADNHPPRGELMEKAVRYFDKFWQQIFAYTNNGRYSIDNNIAERNIRLLSSERKNSLFFGSHKMARASAVYHTVVVTCRMNGISVLEYLKEFFRKAGSLWPHRIQQDIATDDRHTA